MGTGYVRNDTANNIADGNIINASDIDGEYDAIQSAFDASTGHTHDGTAGEGAPIETIGPSQDVVATASVLRPKTDNTVDLGTTSLEYKDLFLDGTAHIDTLDVDENASITGTLGVTGATTATGGLNVDTISEITSANGVVIDGVTLKDGGAIVTADVTFGDNDKVIFGAGSDLSIFHNGTTSLIEDNGTGGITLRSDIFTVQNAAGNETVAQFVQDSFVRLFHDNDTKLATTSTGVDITGIADASTLFRFGVDNSEIANNYLRFKPSGDAFIDHSTVGQDINFRVSNASSLDTTPLVVSSTGISVTGDATFADNDKAIFGAGSDLQIYHDGSNSYIKDLGTGNLIIDGTNLTIRDSNTAKVAISIQNNSDEPLVQLRYDNATKLATTSTGVDITGTLTADAGLTVNATNTDGFDVGLDGSTTSMTLGGLTTGSDVLFTYNRSSGDFFIKNGPRGSEVTRFAIQGGGDIEFYENTGTTAKFFWDASAESLGIGTSSPSSYGHSLVVAKDASGGATYATITNTNANQFLNLGINADVAEITWDNADSLAFGTTAASTDEGQTFEAMRIDSSGNLLVGTTGATLPESGTTSAHVGVSLDASNYVASARYQNIAGYFNRIGNDGDIVQFRKDGAPVGSIGTLNASEFGISSSNDLVLTQNTTTQRNLLFRDSFFGPFGSDNGALDLGRNTSKFRDLYLSGGVYLGGTGSANLLDDYEEGTFTPTIEFGGSSAGVTYNGQEGVYTKVGRLVTCFIRLGLSSNGTASGTARIEGLPFTVGNVLTSTAFQGGSHMVNVSNAAGAQEGFTAVPNEGSTELIIGRIADSNGNSAYTASESHISDTFDMRLTVTYMTA